LPCVTIDPQDLTWLGFEEEKPMMMMMMMMMMIMMIIIIVQMPKSLWLTTTE